MNPVFALILTVFLVSGEPVDIAVTLMPKARERFAEFLDQDSLDRLGILYLTTSVGLGYGRQRA